MPGVIARRVHRLLRRGRLDRLAGALEEPHDAEVVRTGRAEVVGWAASGTGPADRVVVRVVGAVTEAQIGLARDDVARAYPNVPDAGRAGWSAVLDLSFVAGPDAELIATATAGGEEAEIGRVRVQFPATRLIGSRIDHPVPGQGAPGTVLLLYGWAITEPKPVARVFVRVAGQPVGRARLCVLRRDIAHALERRDAHIAGFEHQVALTDVVPVGASVATVEVTVEATDASRFELEPVTFSIPAPTPADAEPDRVTALRDRVAAAAPRRDDRSGRRPRVLVVTHELTLGGGQLYLFELLRNLVPLLPDVEWSIAGSRDGALVPEYEALGFPVHVQGDFPFWQTAAYEGRLEEMAAWAAPRRPDLVIANALVSFPGVDLADRLDVPAVWAIHESYPLRQYFFNVDPTRPVSPAVLERAEAAFASAAAVVFEADATRELFQRHGDPSRFVTVAYGIDLADIDAYRATFDRAATRAAHGFSSDTTVLLCMGTIEARKSQTLLVRAFEAVASRHPEAVLVLVGDRGDEHPANLRSYVAASPVADRIRILPIVTDTYEWYGLSDGLVSASDIESLPRSALEAMAFDLPVIAADAFGVPELLADGRTGYVYAQRDLGALVDALDRFLAEPADRRATVASAASAQVRAQHDSAHYAHVYRDLIRGLLADPRCRPGDVVTARA